MQITELVNYRLIKVLNKKYFQNIKKICEGPVTHKKCKIVHTIKIHIPGKGAVNLIFLNL